MRPEPSPTPPLTPSSTAMQQSSKAPPPINGSSRNPADTQLSPPITATKPSPASPNMPAIPASEAVKTRRRSSTTQSAAKSTFSLPPPPTRSRKIIQMEPRVRPEDADSLQATGKTTPGQTTISPKKKQPSSNSVASRKMARKTAHSLIERRRRSKMNEEFGVLKDMIPACTGEMHKLAILQASIDYVRYLEDCVAKLKAENSRNSSTSTPNASHFMLPPPARKRSVYETEEDVDMDEGSDAASPTDTTPPHNVYRPSLSPAMIPQESRHRQNSHSSSVSSEPRRYSFITSATTSPALLPDVYDYARNSMPGSNTTSPALLPIRDIDEEATSALLMLNTDRRGTNIINNNNNSSSSNKMGVRGMSVRDLLST